MPYAVNEQKTPLCQILEMRDNGRNQFARILPEFGANLIEYAVSHKGETVHLFDRPASMEALTNDPRRYGAPILFPFPNRIRNGVWTWRGKTYAFEDKSNNGNHIHGIVWDKPWQVERFEATSQAAVCSLTLNSEDFEDIERQYPFPFKIRMEHRLQDGSLKQTFSATNVGDGAMPMGVGYHHWFTCPISAKSERSQAMIYAPASAYWELENLLPTGKIVPVSGELDLRNGQSYEGMKFDDVFTQVAFDPQTEQARCRIEDKGAGLRMVFEYPSVYRELVVYTPPTRRCICFEPYTCPTDAPNLAARGLDVGLIELEPGQTWSATMRVFTESMQ